MARVLAATLVEPGRLELRGYPYPDELEPGAVLLRVLASGICGTDKHTYRGETGQYAGTEHARSTPFPIIQGHENVGVVEAVGPGGAPAWDGTGLRPGDRVVPAPNRPCGSCRFCRGDFPEAESAYDRAVSLPIYPRMTDQDQQDVIDAVSDILREARKP